jgi:hypothetical protein
MSISTFEQIEGLKETNIELDFGEPLHEREIELLEMFSEDDEPFVIRRNPTRLLESLSNPVTYRTLESALLDLLSPKGLERLVLSKIAVSKKVVESLRQPIYWCCPKYGLILLLYQKARAPPKYTLLWL